MNLKPRSEWDREDYAAAISELRGEAASLRADAAAKDRLADTLAKETVKFDVLDLPKLNDV